MPAPYPKELRERVARALSEGATQVAAAKRFDVAERTVMRWAQRLEETGSIAPAPMGGARRPYLVDGEGAGIIRDALEMIPDLTLSELGGFYEEVRGVTVSTQTMSDTLRRLGQTKKRAVFRGEVANRPEVVTARENFVAAQPTMDPAKLVFIDESGVDIAMSRTRGWAPPGVTPVIERPARGRRISLIGAIALDGVRGFRQVDGYVDGEEFIKFLREDLGPHLREGDVVVMDGPSIHKVAGVAEALAERGASPLYLPPYSPELNPIEMTWAWLKKLLRDAAIRKLAALRERVTELWGRVTAGLCAGWVKHSGYVPT